MYYNYSSCLDSSGTIPRPLDINSSLAHYADARNFSSAVSCNKNPMDIVRGEEASPLKNILNEKKREQSCAVWNSYTSRFQSWLQNCVDKPGPSRSLRNSVAADHPSQVQNSDVFRAEPVTLETPPPLLHRPSKRSLEQGDVTMTSPEPPKRPRNAISDSPLEAGLESFTISQNDAKNLRELMFEKTRSLEKALHQLGPPPPLRKNGQDFTANRSTSSCEYSRRCSVLTKTNTWDRSQSQNQSHVTNSPSLGNPSESSPSTMQKTCLPQDAPDVDKKLEKEEPIPRQIDSSDPTSCGGYAFDHTAMPKIIAVHSISKSPDKKECMEEQNTRNDDVDFPNRVPTARTAADRTGPQAIDTAHAQPSTVQENKQSRVNREMNQVVSPTGRCENLSFERYLLLYLLQRFQGNVELVKHILTQNMIHEWLAYCQGNADLAKQKICGVDFHELRKLYEIWSRTQKKGSTTELHSSLFSQTIQKMKTRQTGDVCSQSNAHVVTTQHGVMQNSVDLHNLKAFYNEFQRQLPQSSQSGTASLDSYRLESIYAELQRKRSTQNALQTKTVDSQSLKAMYDELQKRRSQNNALQTNSVGTHSLKTIHSELQKQRFRPQSNAFETDLGDSHRFTAILTELQKQRSESQNNAFYANSVDNHNVKTISTDFQNQHSRFQNVLETNSFDRDNLKAIYAELQKQRSQNNALEAKQKTLHDALSAFHSIANSKQRDQNAGHDDPRKSARSEIPTDVQNKIRILSQNSTRNAVRKDLPTVNESPCHQGRALANLTSSIVETSFTAHSQHWALQKFNTNEEKSRVLAKSQQLLFTGEKNLSTKGEGFAHVHSCKKPEVQTQAADGKGLNDLRISQSDHGSQLKPCEQVSSVPLCRNAVFTRLASESSYDHSLVNSSKLAANVHGQGIEPIEKNVLNNYQWRYKGGKLISGDISSFSNGNNVTEIELKPLVSGMSLKNNGSGGDTVGQRHCGSEIGFVSLPVGKLNGEGSLSQLDKSATEHEEHKRVCGAAAAGQRCYCKINNPIGSIQEMVKRATGCDSDVPATVHREKMRTKEEIHINTSLSSPCTRNVEQPLKAGCKALWSSPKIAPRAEAKDELKQRVENQGNRIKSTDAATDEAGYTKPLKAPASPTKKKPYSTVHELGKKILETRERVERETIPWKKKILKSLEAVLTKRLRKLERETGEEAGIELSEETEMNAGKTASKEPKKGEQSEKKKKE